MSINITRRSDSGFSLIEVLIAVVILSFGLLALAALQTRLIQASSESKAQSVALALAKDRLEYMRGFQCMKAPCATGAVTYLGLTDGSDAPVVSGGVTYSRNWAVQRYVLPVGTTAFSTAVGDTTDISGNAAYAPNLEYKTVTVTVTWTDASNNSRKVVMEDALSALDPADSARNQKRRGGMARGPKVIVYDPSTDPGVIPIAVGQDSATAATNPKPVVASVGKGSKLVETRYDVYTYAALTGGKALAQSKVETTVIGCTCSTGSSSTKAFRPTYWNGLRYVPPVRAAYNRPAGAKSGEVQSPYCDACCGSHHDNDGSVTTGPKFSPYRTSSGNGSGHTHLVDKGSYQESCRLIRVDGIFDVASDLSNDYFNLLRTNSEIETLPSGTLAYVPTDGKVDPAMNATGAYQNFVLDYLRARYVGRNPSGGQEITTYNNRVSPAPAAYAGSINDPTPVLIDNSSSRKTRWLHSRGLYIDYLEQEAWDAIGDAQADCPGTGTTAPTANQLRDCVLKVLPFTSINLTELTAWSSTNLTQIKTSIDNPFLMAADQQEPIRGLVELGTGPYNLTLANAVAQIGSSNSGVAAAGAINGDEDELSATQAGPDKVGFVKDEQGFQVRGGVTGEPGGVFNISFADTNGFGWPSNNPAQVRFNYGGRIGSCDPSFSGGKPVNPFVCTTQAGEPLGVAITVILGNYNRQDNDEGVTNPCQAAGAQPITMPYREVRDVVSIVSPGSVGSISEVMPNQPGRIENGGEYSYALVNPISSATPPQTITATLSAPRYLCPDNYPNPGGASAGTPDSRYQCSTDVNPTPQWSNTFVACPGDDTVPPDFD